MLEIFKLMPKANLSHTMSICIIYLFYFDCTKIKAILFVFNANHFTIIYHYVSAVGISILYISLYVTFQRPKNIFKT